MLNKIRKYFARPRNIELLLESFQKQCIDRVSALEELLKVTEERSRSIEHRVNEEFVAIQAPIAALEELLRVTEERSRSIEYQVNECLTSIQYQIDLVLKNKIDDYSFAGSGAPLKKNDNSIAGYVCIKTEHPLAIQSNDHINPQSTMEGLVRPTKFVMHCIDNLGNGIKVLDVGVGAAGLVFEFLANGIFALGIDGSDYCKKQKIGYWPLIGERLFNSDITKPFGFYYSISNETLLFDLISSWECLEHIAEEDLPAVFKNVINNLTDEGYFIGSISMLPYMDDNGQPYHLTLKAKDWWKRIFLANGLEMCDQHQFNERFFCRGNGPSFQDKHNYFQSPSDGFHFVAKKCK